MDLIKLIEERKSLEGVITVEDGIKIHHSGNYLSFIEHYKDKKIDYYKIIGGK